MNKQEYPFTYTDPVDGRVHTRIFLMEPTEFFKHLNEWSTGRKEALDLIGLEPDHANAEKKQFVEILEKKNITKIHQNEKIIIAQDAPVEKISFFRKACNAVFSSKKPQPEPKIEPVKDGLEQYWYPDGRIDKEISWKNGEKHGHEKQHQYLTSSNHLLISRYWRNGKKDSVEVLKNEKGRITSITAWRNGQKHGLEELFGRKDNYGIPGSYDKLTTEWNHGQKDGFEKCYYKNHYSVRPKLDKWVFYENGKEISSGRYQQSFDDFVAKLKAKKVAKSIGFPLDFNL